ncbi:uncharacterized protein BDR25DRAFT_340381 [Lindgomyces ingoldianus]|uniref:Uncharacterized protein n=1 Tax=Lindgomyces ingoldianus TaxID=673940 RepID=A0ACB6R5Y2_9PLEO|nr:uncharacterized protein BDR25DRAFT_340381 [Lindgomyces ingoldianus]KAF2474586.1 hypothetical protein BDR25DRAFT_340381 [Lindgomyces ingoldianus]
MSAQDFDGALAIADETAFAQQLDDLISRPQGAPPGIALAHVAEKYLRAFADDSTSYYKRRWIGITLRHMVDTPPVVKHLKTRPQGLHQLGAIIAKDTELEETKIVAGITIRQALQNGIKFANCWPSPKIPNNAPNFPTDSSGTWLTDFQQYLDTLERELHLIPKSKTDPAVLYPVSLIASDGFKQAATVMLSVIQYRSVTLITSDYSPRNLGFVDVPLRHIHDIRLQKSSLHDSQARTTEHEPWDIVLTLRHGQWTYRVNAEHHDGSELTILLQGYADAKECESCIKEAIDRLSTIQASSSSQILDASVSGDSNTQRADHGSHIPRRAKYSVQVTDVGFSTGRRTQEVAQPNFEPSLALLNGDSNKTGSTRGIEEPKWSPNAWGLSPEIALVNPNTNPNNSGPDQELERPGDGDASSSGPRPVKLIHDVVSSAERSTSMPKNDPVNEPQIQVLENTGILKKAQRKSAPGALPVIKKKPSRAHDQTEGTSLCVREDMDEFGFPDEPPRIKRSLATGKESPRTKFKPTTAASRPPCGSIGKAKLIRPKPKPTQRQQFNDTEDDEDPLNTHKAQLTEVIQNRSSEAMDISRTPQITEPKEKREEIKSGLKPSRLPKVSKATTSERGSRKRKRPSEDVFTIPPDEEPRGKRHTRREAAKSVDYNEAESSGYGGSESDYTEAKPAKSRSAAMTSSTQKVTSKTQTGKASAPKSSGRGEASRASEVEDILVSPGENSIVAKMLSRSQPATQDVPKKTKGNSSMRPIQKIQVSKVAKKEPQSVQGQAIKKNGQFSQDQPEIIMIDSCSESLDETDSGGEDIDLGGACIQEIPVARPTTSQDSASSNELPLTVPILCRSPLNAINRSQALLPTASPKQSAEYSSPSTPKAKRMKEFHTREPKNPDVTKKTFKNPLVTVAPPRLLEDPTSPCPDTQCGRQAPNLPSANQSLGNLMQSLDSSPRGSEDAASVVRRGQHGPSHKMETLEEAEMTKTPSHLHPQRRYSGGSVSSEILSSNNKPVPASPHSDSRAISGHAEREHVEMEKEIGEWETAKSDPFKQRSKWKPRTTSFTRRLTEGTTVIEEPELPEESPQKFRKRAIAQDPVAPEVIYESRSFRVPLKPKGSTQKRNARSQVIVDSTSKHRHSRQCAFSKVDKGPPAPEHLDINLEDSEREAPRQVIEEMQPQDVFPTREDYLDIGGDDTLVAYEEEPPTILNASPVQFRSSPPSQYPPSSHSSTSAEIEQGSESSIPTEVAEEMEWEASLQPHQRAIGEQLIRISRRVLRHIVDNETAVNDIAETYARDGEHLLKTLIERHSGELDGLFEGVEKKKQGMKKDFELMAQRLAKERKHFQEHPKAIPGRREGEVRTWNKGKVVRI